MTDLSKCPNCGGEADNGHDRCYPPNPYYCKKCMKEGQEMTRTEELLALAENTIKAESIRPKGKSILSVRLIEPETIKQLVELAVLQNANMLKIQEHSHGSCVNYAWCKEAITAFERFEKGVA